MRKQAKYQKLLWFSGRATRTCPRMNCWCGSMDRVLATSRCGRSNSSMPFLETPLERSCAACAIQGHNGQGVHVVDCGLNTTDELSFLAGDYNFPGGIMITASDNPKEYNGMKFCRAQAYAISLDTGLADIRDLAIRGDFPE